MPGSTVTTLPGVSIPVDTPHSASISVEVYRVGTIGRAKSKNKILVTVDLKDINKFTDVEIYLTDE